MSTFLCLCFKINQYVNKLCLLIQLNIRAWIFLSSSSINFFIATKAMMNPEFSLYPCYRALNMRYKKRRQCIGFSYDIDNVIYRGLKDVSSSDTLKEDCFGCCLFLNKLLESGNTTKLKCE